MPAPRAGGDARRIVVAQNLRGLVERLLHTVKDLPIDRVTVVDARFTNDGAEEGLVVPVLRDADHMTFAEIEKKIDAYITKVRDKTLTIEDLQGGTFSITNGGVFGSLLSTPILNPPQVGILGMHRFEDRPVAKDGRVVIRPMMYLALTYDHRVVDGREAVQFLYRIKELIEDPERLLLEG